MEVANNSPFLFPDKIKEQSIKKRKKVWRNTGRVASREFVTFLFLENREVLVGFKDIWLIDSVKMNSYKKQRGRNKHVITGLEKWERLSEQKLISGE